MKVALLSLRKPPVDSICRFLAAQGKQPFSYPSVGASAKTLPPGYVVDRTRVKLGEGEPVFQAARAALERWEHFQLGWVDAWPTDTRIRPNEVVAVMGHAIGMWWLNACRIVYVVDEAGPVARFGFAYGTLPGHVESGEERFLIEWDQETNSVWYDIVAYSRPNRFLARLGYPLVRRLQKQFGQDSVKAMARAVSSVAKQRQE